MKNRNLLIIGGIIAGLFLITCVCCLGFGALGSLAPSSLTTPQIAKLPTTVATSKPIPPTSIPSPVAPAAPTDTPIPTTATSQGPEYVPLLGKIWSGVKVYYGDAKTYGFEILGGSDNCSSMPSGRGVKVRFPSESEEWKDRDYLVSSGDFFVLEDDPALSKMEWYEFDCQEPIEMEIIPTSPPPTLPPQPTTAPPPTTAPVAACDCSADIYNCDSFNSAAAAHACFDYCQSVGAGDIHNLDGDADGEFCE